MHLRNKFETLEPHTLSKEENYEVLESDLFIKDKKEKPFR